MAKSTTAVATRLTTTVATGSPYQLDSAQLSKATTALLAHIKSHAVKKEQQATKKSLLADSDGAEDGTVAALQGVPIWLTVGTKKHITDHTKLKPSKVVLPHSINKGDARICLITVDPQRAYKDLTSHPAFPTQLASQIGRVIGLSKLKAKYKSYESRRQLAAEYDIFMADDRVVQLLPSILGKTFYAGNSKRPIPVNLTTGTKRDEIEDKSKKNKDESEVRVGTPEAVGREIESALSATVVNLSTSTNSSIKVGSTLMTTQQLDENVEAVVLKLTEKFVPKGWRGIRSLHIKGPNTMALPIWLADELWAEEGDVLEQKWTPPVRDGAPRVNEKKRRWDEWENELLDEEELSTRRSRRKSKKPKALEGDKEQTESISSKKSKKKLKQDALKSVQTHLIAG